MSGSVIHAGAGMTNNRNRIFMTNYHLQHIANNKQNLIDRFNITKYIREFFWSENFTEVETPIIVALPGQEPYLSPMSLTIHNERGKEFTGYLHTSPEYTMKKMLAAGFTNIFSLCKCFRDNESFGGTHNPEFTMIEWYRAEKDFYKIMDDVEGLFSFVNKKMNFKEMKKFRRAEMKELWQEFVGVNLDEYLEKEKMFELCVNRGFNPDKNESYEDLFYRIFLNEIEPKLVDPTIVYHYPACMAALSKISEKDSNYAERFEVYVNGLEMANAFTELTDADEQLKRLNEEKELRKKLGKPVYGIDMEFIGALKSMPPAAGIALGVDRFVQALGGCQNINNVLVLPASKMYDEDDK